MDISRTAYLAMEAAETERRHEYWEGQVWAMTGTTPEHNDLVSAFATELRARLRAGPCRTYSESVRTRIAERKYVYPDVVVACPPRFDRAESSPSLLNPQVVVEVLSPSIADYDRGDKLRAYYEVPEIQEIVLADPTTVDVVHHRRSTDGSWAVRIHGPGSIVHLDSLDVRLEVDALYADLTPSDDGRC